jgi:adenosine/AMP kinase
MKALYSLAIKGYYLFLLFLIKEAFPINVLPRLKDVPEIVNIFCAS